VLLPTRPPPARTNPESRTHRGAHPPRYNPTARPIFLRAPAQGKKTRPRISMPACLPLIVPSHLPRPTCTHTDAHDRAHARAHACEHAHTQRLASLPPAPSHTPHPTGSHTDARARTRARTRALSRVSPTRASTHASSHTRMTAHTRTHAEHARTHANVPPIYGPYANTSPLSSPSLSYQQFLQSLSSLSTDPTPR
jgi:hypothetical protein